MEGINAVPIFQFITLLLGSGVFVLLLKLTFTLGQYSQRVENMERMLGDFRIELSDIRRLRDN